jgi:hypothetical protein
MNDFDRMINSLTLLNEVELEALAEVCQTRVEAKRKARREGLRQELMSNFQSALSDILHNDFTLVITNPELNPEEDECYGVCFNPEDIHSVKINIIDTK